MNFDTNPPATPPDPHDECRKEIERLKTEVKRFKDFGVVMARACGNWREWPDAESGDDHKHPDWKAAARALIERDELKLNCKIAVAECDKFKAVLEAILIPTNFISLDAARDYISEALGVGKYASDEPVGEDEEGSDDPPDESHDWCADANCPICNRRFSDAL